QEVGSGSNHSNLGTHNASGSVAANARNSQTITSISDSLEHFTRKDRPEFAHIHGADYTEAERKWHANTQAALQNQPREDFAQYGIAAGGIPAKEARQRYGESHMLYGDPEEDFAKYGIA